MLLRVRSLRGDWPVAAAFLVALMGVATVAAMNGYKPFAGGTWSRWDSALYQSIALHGYQLSHCVPPVGMADEWCGNAAWFPAYPWLFGALHKAGLPLQGMAVLISWAFTAATLWLLWAGFLGRRLSVPAVGALAWAAFAPGQIFDYALFPLSMLAFFATLHLFLLWRERWVMAGLAGAVAALTYPIGVTLVAVSGLWLLFVARGARWRERLRRVAIASGLTACGALIVIVDQRIEVGRWNAFFLVQDKYDHGFHDPFSATWKLIHPLFKGSPWTIDKAPAAQTLLVSAVLLLLVVHAALRWRRLTQLDGMLLIFAVVIWAFPLTQGHVSIYRSQAALLPVALLVRHLPRPLLFVACASALWLTVPMTQLFVQTRLM